MSTTAFESFLVAFLFCNIKEWPEGWEMKTKLCLPVWINEGNTGKHCVTFSYYNLGRPIKEDLSNVSVV